MVATPLKTVQICIRWFHHLDLQCFLKGVSRTKVKARIFLLVDLREFFFSDLGSGGRKNKFKKLFFIISRTNSKISKVNQQSVLNL